MSRTWPENRWRLIEAYRSSVLAPAVRADWPTVAQLQKKAPNALKSFDAVIEPPVVQIGLSTRQISFRTRRVGFARRGALFFDHGFHQRSRGLAAPCGSQEREQFLVRDLLEAHEHGGKAAVVILGEEFFGIGRKDRFLLFRRPAPNQHIEP